jgi:hypothetical protein
VSRLILAAGFALWLLVILATVPLLVPVVLCCWMFPSVVPMVERSIRAIHGVPFRVCMRGATGLDRTRAGSV